MSIQSLAEEYNVPARIGGKVRIQFHTGVIEGADDYNIHVYIDYLSVTVLCNPKDLTYID